MVHPSIALSSSLLITLIYSSGQNRKPTLVESLVNRTKTRDHGMPGAGMPDAGMHRFIATIVVYCNLAVMLVSDIAMFVLKRDVKLQLTNCGHATELPLDKT